MSPAPIVISRSPSSSLGPSASTAVSAVGEPPHPPSPGTVRGLIGHHQAAYPGEGPDRLLASRVDVEDRDLVGRGERRAELRRERLGP